MIKKEERNDTRTCLIDGEWLASTSGEVIEVENPANGSIIGLISRGDERDIDQAVCSAQVAAESWKNVLPVERSRILYRVSELIKQRADELAQLESVDTGKPLLQAKSDVATAARFFEYYAGLADKVLGTSIPLGPDFLDFTVRDPYGVSGQIVPWNYPIQISARGIAPALASGNAVVVKPAEQACLTVIELAKICISAGVPKGVLNLVTGYGHEAGAALARHKGVNQVVFTGSVVTGTSVMSAAAKNIVPVLLELGGKSPNVVLGDADVSSIVKTLVKAGMPNSGQTCSAATRILVHRSRYAETVQLLKAEIREMTLGEGLSGPDIGPLISAAQRQRVLNHVRMAEDEGASVYIGGLPNETCDEVNGFYVRPTLVYDVTPQMSIFREEVFGPVISVSPFDDEEHAVSLANDTDYGLVAGVWGRDSGPLLRVANRLRAGQVFVNCYSAGGGVEIPFGGYGKSGFGREKGLEGLYSYTQVRNLCVRLQ